MEALKNKIVSIGTAYAANIQEDGMKVKKYTINEIMVCIAGMALLFVAVTALYAFQNLLTRQANEADSRRSN